MEMYPRSMFDLGDANFDDMFCPFAVLHKQFCSRAGQENVPAIAAIHDPLREIDAATGNIVIPLDVFYAIHRSAMHAHSELDLRPFLKGFGDLYRTTDGRFGTPKKCKRHSVSGMQNNKFI